jgi:hypothetical protein
MHIVVHIADRFYQERTISLTVTAHRIRAKPVRKFRWWGGWGEGGFRARMEHKYDAHGIELNMHAQSNDCMRSAELAKQMPPFTS